MSRVSATSPPGAPGATGSSPLDNPVWSSLVGAHAHLAERHGGAARYRADTARFAALPDEPGPGDWGDLARLSGPGGTALLFRRRVVRPEGWTADWVLPGVQMAAPPGLGTPDPEAMELSPADAAEATALVEATRPGPWRPRTIEMGRYVGIRRGGRLVAMAGQRLRPEGFVEISAVCTAPEARGRGLASRLVCHLVALVEADGAGAVLHVAEENGAAVRLYEQLGFAHRGPVAIEEVRPPER